MAQNAKVKAANVYDQISVELQSYELLKLLQIMCRQRDPQPKVAKHCYENVD